MSLIITAVMIVYVLLLGLFVALSARKHHWIMALIRTANILIAAVIAVPVSKAIAGAMNGLVAPMFEDMLLGMGEIGELVEHAPVLSDSVAMMVTLIIAPIVFLVMFLLVRGLLSIAAWIVEKTVPYFKERRPKKGEIKVPNNTAIAMPVGAFNGILIALVTLIPLCGYIGLVSAFMGMADMGSTSPDAEASVSVTVPTVEYLAEEDAASVEDNVEEDADADASTEEDGGVMGMFTEILENVNLADTAA